MNSRKNKKRLYKRLNPKIILFFTIKNNERVFRKLSSGYNSSVSKLKLRNRK